MISNNGLLTPHNKEQSTTFEALSSLLSNRSFSKLDSFGGLLSSFESANRPEPAYRPSYNDSRSATNTYDWKSLPVRTDRRADSATPADHTRNRNTDSISSRGPDRERTADRSYSKDEPDHLAEDGRDDKRNRTEAAAPLTAEQIATLSALVRDLEATEQNTPSQNSDATSQDTNNGFMNLEALAELIDSNLSEEEKQALLNGLAEETHDMETAAQGTTDALISSATTQTEAGTAALAAHTPPSSPTSAAMNAIPGAGENSANSPRNNTLQSNPLTSQGASSSAAAQQSEAAQAAAAALGNNQPNRQNMFASLLPDSTQQTGTPTKTDSVETSAIALAASTTPTSKEELQKILSELKNIATAAERASQTASQEQRFSASTHPSISASDSLQAGETADLVTKQRAEPTTASASEGQKEKASQLQTAQQEQSRNQQTAEEANAKSAPGQHPTATAGAATTGNANTATSSSQQQAGSASPAPTSTTTTPTGIGMPSTATAQQTNAGSFAQMVSKASSYNTNSPVSEQVAIQISRAAGQGEERLTIRLNPADLGRIDVQLVTDKDGQARIHITADQSQTLDMLQRDQRGLERALNEAGLKTDQNSLSFNLRDSNQQQSQQQAQNNTGNNSGQNNREDTPHNRAQGNADNDENEYLERTNWILTPERLDVRI